MVTSYLAEELFSETYYIRSGYSSENIDQANIANLTEYDESLVDSILDNEISSIFHNPSMTRYNVICGFTSSNLLVFIAPLSIDFTGYVVNSIDFDIVKISASVEVNFNLEDPREFTSHSHGSINVNVSPIEKFTNYLFELTDNDDELSKGRIVSRNQLNIPYGVHVLDNNLAISSISQLTGVYGVDFRYEVLPSNIIPALDTTDGSQFSPNRDSLTYRGNAYCYKINGRYYIKKGTVKQEFTTPVTLVNEYTAIREVNSQVGEIIQWNGHSWINFTLMESTKSLVCYRSLFILSNNIMSKII